MLRLPPALALFAALAPLPAHADVLLVHPDGSGPYPTIQAAVDAALDGDEVHLTEGTYTGEGNRDVDFQGKATTVRSQSGDPASVSIDLGWNEHENTRAFLLDSGEGAEAVIAGITIRNAWFPTQIDFEAVRCIGTSPTIQDCVFRDNTQVCIRATGGSPTIERCRFFDNYTYPGTGTAISASTATIRDCEFINNHNGTGMNAAGAVYLGSGLISHCLFRDNIAYVSGGAVVTGALVEDCQFINNGGTWRGGALSTSGIVRRCLFRGNWAERGSAIAVESPSTALIEACTFVGNDGRIGGDCISISAGLALLAYNIISLNVNSWNGTSEGAVRVVESGALAISCCDVFGNEGGDWVGALSTHLGVDGNISADPLFCDADDGEYTLYGSSPCAPANAGGCGLIGAFPVGCGPVSLENKSWGEIKGHYRR